MEIKIAYGVLYGVSFINTECLMLMSSLSVHRFGFLAGNKRVSFQKIVFHVRQLHVTFLLYALCATTTKLIDNDEIESIKGTCLES